MRCKRPVNCVSLAQYVAQAGVFCQTLKSGAQRNHFEVFLDGESPPRHLLKGAPTLATVSIVHMGGVDDEHGRACPSVFHFSRAVVAIL